MASEELRLVADTQDMRPSQLIARKVRGLLGENQISGRRMANALGMNTSSFHRRYTGETAWSTDELGTLSKMLKVPYSDLLCANRDLNPEPADSRPIVALKVVADERVRVNVVVPFPGRSETSEVALSRPALQLVRSAS